MASTIKVDTITTPDGTGNITVDRPLSGSGAGLTSLPAANLTGALPAISGASLTDVGGGAWTLIGTAVASTSATLTQTGLASTYGTYAIAFSAMRPSTTAQPWLRFGESDGIDSGSDHYRWYVSSKHETRSDDSAAEIELAHQDGVLSTSSFSAMLYLQTQESSGASSNIHGTGSTNTIDSGQYYAHRMGGVRDDLITLDRIQFLFSTGTITSGRMTVWGIAHA